MNKAGGADATADDSDARHWSGLLTLARRYAC